MIGRRFGGFDFDRRKSRVTKDKPTIKGKPTPKRNKIGAVERIISSFFKYLATCKGRVSEEKKRVLLYGLIAREAARKIGHCKKSELDFFNRNLVLLDSLINRKDFEFEKVKEEFVQELLSDLKNNSNVFEGVPEINLHSLLSLYFETFLDLKNMVEKELKRN